MQAEKIIDFISKGRTDFIFRLLQVPNWKDMLNNGQVKPLQWLVYYNDTTAIRAVLEAGGNLDSINLNSELGNAAFFGHWKVCDFLINRGADVNAHIDKTNETPLHNALAKAGKPYYFYTVKLLIDKGANVNAKTIPGIVTGAFMRDVRTKGETPLHRAAAYADEGTLKYLIDKGAKLDSKDSNGNSPLSWASEHIRPASILSLLCYDNFQIWEVNKTRNISDHGQ